MKIIHLVLFSPGYEAMKEATQDLYGANTFYYSFADIQEPWRIDGNRLLIQGTETYVPGILDKTLIAMSLMQEYDYILRSNVSTVVDVKKIAAELQQNPIDYGGSYLHQLRWLDPKCGITSQKYWGTTYVSGTCIILSKHAVSRLLCHPIDRTVIDDVAIGVAMKECGMSPVGYAQHYTSGTERGKWFYRNWSRDRGADALNMQKLCSQIAQDCKGEHEGVDNGNDQGGN